MTLLAVATSSPQGSLAIAEESLGELRLKQQVTWDKKAMHSELATVKFVELLDLAGLTVNSLTHIAVVNGPGSFTGIRVGVNLARTLAYGLALPVATANSLALLAFRQMHEGESGLVALKAVQNHCYAAVYEKTAGRLKEILSPRSIPRAKLDRYFAGKSWIEGEGAAFSPVVTAADLVEFLGRTSAQFSPWKETKPLYIRASEAEEKLRQGLLKPLG